MIQQEYRSFDSYSGMFPGADGSGTHELGHPDVMGDHTASGIPTYWTYAKNGYLDHHSLSFDAYDKFGEGVFLNCQRLDPVTDGGAG